MSADERADVEDPSGERRGRGGGGGGGDAGWGGKEVVRRCTFF